MAAVGIKDNCEKLMFWPSKSVIFMPNCSKQMTSMTILNNSSKTQVFKMKSTKPKMFKMRPVYGAVYPKQKAVVKLFFKGLKPGQDAPLKQRFTVVSTDAPPGKINAERVWKAQKSREKTFDAGVEKRRFSILFCGINDHDERQAGKKVARKKKQKLRISSRKKVSKSSEESNKSSGKSTTIESKSRSEMMTVKGRGKLDIKIRQSKVKEQTVEEEVKPQTKKKIVIIMYRDYPKDQKIEDSLSGDEDDEDSAKTQSKQGTLKSTTSIQLGAKKTGPSIKQKKDLEKLDEDLLTRKRQSAESPKKTAATERLL